MARFENRVHDSLESIATFVSDKDVMCKSANTTMVIRGTEEILESITDDIKNIICQTFDTTKAHKICKMNYHGECLFIRFKREIHC